MSDTTIVPNNKNDTVLSDINEPSGWAEYPMTNDVISGEPDCKFKLIRSAGVTTKEIKVCFFSAEPSVFEWYFNHDESFVLLEGKLSMKMNDGSAFEVLPSQALSVAGGSKAVCTVLEPSRKFTVVTGGDK